MDIEAIEKKLRFAPITHAYDERDMILYALGLGFGDDATSKEQLRFVYEDGLQAVPSMVNILAPGLLSAPARIWHRLGSVAPCGTGIHTL
jgi:hypothetical protein